MPALSGKKVKIKSSGQNRQGQNQEFAGKFETKIPPIHIFYMDGGK
jgi:hypothetical protein